MDMLASLHAFITVVEEGGFAAAGRKLSLATSSVTRQVDSLETQLGTRLLTRTTRHVTLTTAGQTYYEHTVRIIHDLEYANQEVRDRGGEPRGILRISLPVSFARLHVAPLLALFSRRYPLIFLDLTLTDEVVDLVEKRLDLSVRLGNIESPNLIARRLRPQQRCVCASPEYLQRQGTPETPGDLKEHNCLLFSYSSGKTRWYFDGATRAAVDVKGTLKCNNAEILREAVLNGYGIALLPDWLIEKDLSSGRLVQLLSPWRAEVSDGDNNSGIYAVYHPTHRDTRKAKIFVDFLKEHLNPGAEKV